MTLVWTRIDQKLIHGQIALAWTPHLKIDAIVVADKETRANPRGQLFMQMGLPPEIRATFFVEPAALEETLASKDLEGRRVLLLFKDMAGLFEAVTAGLSIRQLNLGYHAFGGAPEAAVRLGQSFYLGEDDLKNLAGLHAGGLEITIQSIPTDKAVRWSPDSRHHA